MKASFKQFFLKHPILIGLAIFALVMLPIQFFNYQHYRSLKNQESAALAKHTIGVEADLQEILSQSASSAKILQFIVADYGVPENFDSLAQAILEAHHHIDGLQLLDSAGTMVHGYPPQKNEVLGLDVLHAPPANTDGAGNLRLKDHSMQGPFSLKQGGQSFMGRSPIYKNGAVAGFAATVVKVPTLRRALGLDSLQNHPFSYQFLALDENGDEKVLFTSKTLNEAASGATFVQIDHAPWKVQLYPNQRGPYTSVWLFLGLGAILALCSGLLTWQLLGTPNHLKQMVQEKTKLLRQSNEKFKSLVDQATDGIFITSKQGVIEEVNLKGATMLGYKENELTGRTLTDIYDPTELQLKPIRFKELWAGKAILHERRMRRKDGTIFYGEVNAKMIPDGKFLGILRDITERRETRLMMERQNVALEKTNAELAQFVYSASHDLRAPLSSLLGLIDIIKLEHQEPELQKKLSMMNKALLNMDNFINDIIHYSRNRHVPVAVETIDFNKLMTNVLTSLWYLPNRNHIEITLGLVEYTPFFSDRKRVSVLLSNLISNAIKYHDLEDRDPKILVQADTDEDRAILTIRDNGPGIPEDQLDKIFHMFYRIPSKAMGSGLGLYIVKEVLDKMNGSIQVSSKMGQGTLFTVTIPNQKQKVPYDTKENIAY